MHRDQRRLAPSAHVAVRGPTVRGRGKLSGDRAILCQVDGAAVAADGVAPTQVSWPLPWSYAAVSVISVPSSKVPLHVLRQFAMPDGLLVTPPAAAEVPMVTVRVCPPAAMRCRCRYRYRHL